MPPRACDRQHVDDPSKVLVDADVWARMQAGAVKAQEAQGQALQALSTVAEQVQRAVMQEREASASLRSNDVTSLQDANRILAEQLAAASRHHEERDKRILALQAQCTTLLGENAALKGERGDLSIALAKEEKELRLGTEREITSRQQFEQAMQKLEPFAPLLSALAMKYGGIAGGFGGFGVPASGGGPAPSSASGAQGQAEVLEAVTWSHDGIEEWKKVVAEVVMAASGQTAAMYRLYMCSLIDQLSNPGALPAFIRPLVVDAGPERVQRLQELTRAAQPQPN